MRYDPLPEYNGKQMTTKDKSPSRTTAFDPKAVPPAEFVQQQFGRTVTSLEFKGIDVRHFFSKFVVERVLAGQYQEIEGYTIATRVCCRGEVFNQTTDPIVRIHVSTRNG